MLALLADRSTDVNRPNNRVSRGRRRHTMGITCCLQLFPAAGTGRSQTRSAFCPSYVV